MNSKEIIDKLLNGEMKLYQVDKYVHQKRLQILEGNL